MGILVVELRNQTFFTDRKGFAVCFTSSSLLGNVWCKLKAEINRNIKMNSDVLRLESYLMSLMFMYYTKHSDSLFILFAVHVSMYSKQEYLTTFGDLCFLHILLVAIVLEVMLSMDY